MDGSEVSNTKETAYLVLMVIRVMLVEDTSKLAEPPRVPSNTTRPVNETDGD